jgi:hypothetical protein
MHILERRISALEQASPAGRITAIIHRVVTPGDLDAEAQTAKGVDGGEWTRKLGETENDLIDRALREVSRNRHGVARLIVSPCW